MEGELLGSGGSVAPPDSESPPSEQLPPGPWRPPSFRAALQRPDCWWMPPTIRLRGGGPGSGLCGPGRVNEGGWAPAKDISPITLPLGTMRTVSSW